MSSSRRDFLKGLGVTTFLTHSSLSADERHQAEEAFESGQNCVIVATSTMELGIDVGGLDAAVLVGAAPTQPAIPRGQGEGHRHGGGGGGQRIVIFLNG